MTSRILPRAAAWPFALLALLSEFGPSARANFVLVDQHLALDRAAHRADFTLTFNQRPDFTTVDPVGRQKNSFQIEFDGDPLHSSQNGNGLTAIIRGEEIHLTHKLRVRAATGDGGPNSGGWGPVVQTVPFDLDNETLTFTTTTEALGLTGRRYRYSAFSLEFGGLTAEQDVQFVPLRSAAAMFPGGALVAAFVMWRMRHRHA